MDEFCIVQVKHIYSKHTCHLKEKSECIVELEASSVVHMCMFCSAVMLLDQGNSVCTGSDSVIGNV
jgi:hypothetical protein